MSYDDKTNRFDNEIPIDFYFPEHANATPGEVMPAFPSGIPYVGDQVKVGSCGWEEGCGANKIKGGVYCVGHTRKLAKQGMLAEQAPVAEDDVAVEAVGS